MMRHLAMLLALAVSAGTAVAQEFQAGIHYQVIDPAPLPVKVYESTMTVMQLAPGLVDITWTSAYQNNSNGEMADEEVIGFINGVYATGLQQVKSMAVV